MLAAQAAVALDNAQWAQGLEAEGRGAHGGARGVQRAHRAACGELAIINSLQQGIAGSLDFQAIVDLVGDKLREVLRVKDIGIQWFDAAGNRLLFLYAYEHGERLNLAPISLPDSAKRFIRTRQPELYRTAAEQIAAGVRRGPRHRPEPVQRHGPDRRRATACSASSRWRTTSARTPMASPSCGCCRPWRLRSVSRWRTPASSTKSRRATHGYPRRSSARPPATTSCASSRSRRPTSRPVLDVIARHAALISGSDDAIIGLRDGDTLIVAAHHGDIPMIPIGQGIRFNRESVAGRAIIDGRPVQTVHGSGRRPVGVSGRRRRGRAVRLPRDLRGAADARGCGHRCDRHPPRQPRAPERGSDLDHPVVRQPGRHRDRQRAPVRRDRPAAQGDRAARHGARGHQQHPGRHGGLARLPGDRRSRGRQGARGVRFRRHRHPAGCDEPTRN